MSDARYVVGIDLGTTNSVLAWVDTAAVAPGAEAPRVEVLRRPAAREAGRGRGARPAAVVRLSAGGERVPAREPRRCRGDEPSTCVGELARARGAEVPARVVASAKSWLCSVGARSRPARSCRGTRPTTCRACRRSTPRRPISRICARRGTRSCRRRSSTQEVYLTVPASFDAAARELTVRAAERGRPRRRTLLEEPQAAFYAWLADTRRRAGDRRCSVGDVVLVCDVGGGTTDLTLVAVGEESGSLVLERVAVGDHILLGGDNMDLALAHAVRARLAERRHDARRVAAPRPGARLPRRQGEAARRRRARRRRRSSCSGARARSSAARCARGDARRGRRGARRRLLPRGRRATSGRAPRRRVGLQEIGLPYASDPGGHAPPRRRSSAATATSRPTGRPRCCSTAA